MVEIGDASTQHPACCEVEQETWKGQGQVGDLKITSTSTERQKRSQNSAPVLVIIFGNSLVFSRKIITSTGFYRYCAPGASAPVVVKNQSPIKVYRIGQSQRVGDRFLMLKGPESEVQAKFWPKKLPHFCP